MTSRRERCHACRELIPLGQGVTSFTRRFCTSTCAIGWTKANPEIARTAAALASIGPVIHPPEKPTPRIIDLDEDADTFDDAEDLIAQYGMIPLAAQRTEAATVQRVDLFGTVTDTFQTEAELAGIRATQGRMF